MGLEDFQGRHGSDVESFSCNQRVDQIWGEKKGNVRLSHDTEKRPYLSRIELKAILCAMAEVVSMRFVNGVGQRVGLMGIDYPTSRWLYKDGGYKAYMVESVEDLTKPFVSMYFGAVYVAWLTKYEGRERTPQFVVQAYLNGPKNVDLEDKGGEEALSRFLDLKNTSWGRAIRMLM